MADISKLLGSGVGGPEIQAQEENPIFGELSASLKNISEGITKLNENISSLVSIEAKEGKESRAETVERFKQQFETEQQASGGGDNTDLLTEIKENIQRNFLKEFKVLEMIERNTQGGGVSFIPSTSRVAPVAAAGAAGAGLAAAGAAAGATKVGTASQRNKLAQDLKQAKAAGATKEELRAMRDAQKNKLTTGSKPSMLSRVGSGVKSVGKFAARFAGPLAVGGLAALSGYQGSQRAGEFFGKEQGDATLGEKTAAGVGQFASDITFGMLDPKEVALSIKKSMDIFKNFFLETIPKFFTEDIPNFFTEKFEQLKETFPETFKVITDDIPKIFTETIPQKLGEAKDLIEEKISAIKTAIVSTFQSLGDSIKQGFQKMIDFFKNLLQNPGDILKQAVASTSENISNTLSNAYTGAKDLLGLSNDKSESVSPQATNQTSVALRNTTEELNNANDMNDAGTSSKINTTVNQITAGSQTTSVTAMKPSPRSHPSNNSFASISSRDAVLI